MENVIDPVYLPFTASELRQHFVGEKEAAIDSRVRKFAESAECYRLFTAAHQDRRGIPMSEARGPCQIEKDETFWTAATMMALSRSPVNVIGRWLARALGDHPPFDIFASWEQALGSQVRLVLEAPLPAPKAYRSHARSLAPERHIIQYVRHAGLKRGTDDVRGNLEGTTRVDAVLVAVETGFSVLIEAKVLSDISNQVSFDPLRNQLTRLLDVMLEPASSTYAPLKDRKQDRSVAVLLTPRLFKDNPHSRLYGRLFEEYRGQPDALGRDLPHRAGMSWAELSSRLGWVTWEDTNALLPGACRWLNAAGIT